MGLRHGCTIPEATKMLFILRRPDTVKDFVATFTYSATKNMLQRHLWKVC